MRSRAGFLGDVGWLAPYHQRLMLLFSLVMLICKWGNTGMTCRSKAENPGFWKCTMSNQSFGQICEKELVTTYEIRDD